MDHHSPNVIFVSGPIGVGKSTFGTALAQALGGHFIEGDDHGRQDLPWHASALTAPDAWEHRRIRALIEQGYGQREFSDLIIRTDLFDQVATLNLLIKQLGPITGSR